EQILLETTDGLGSAKNRLLDASRVKLHQSAVSLLNFNSTILNGHSGIPFVRQLSSIPEIGELKGGREFPGAQSGDDGVRVVSAFAGDAYFFTLDLGSHFEFAVADESGDLFGYRLFEALFDFDHLPGVSERGNIRLGTLDVFGTDIAFDQFPHDDF